MKELIDRLGEMSGSERLEESKMGKKGVPEILAANNKAYMDKLEALTRKMAEVAKSWGHEFTSLSFSPDRRWKWLQLNATYRVRPGTKGGTESEMVEFLEYNYGLDAQVKKVGDTYEITQDFHLIF